MNIGYVIKTLRKQRKMTQEQIALEADIATSNVSRIEQGLRQPSQKVLQKISQALGTTPSVLYAACEQPESEVPSFLEHNNEKTWHDQHDILDLCAGSRMVLKLYNELTTSNQALLRDQLKALHQWQLSFDNDTEGVL
ncbi:anaerobic benzoate catabolism transcriptional regulator [Marinomonas aquimarina]|uniref:Anaerobic benzoate catabolism transcriptional regulator n=1 Tax=Marinomonas aquimarina TaxID=295068 RepID=A0A1A8TD21_9GAMM|nr:helix-turn-helix domain-containing protein [Marinomonas aquimarina]SBS30675.1 anaerobic benzoate catabolism transcriptional regulator [Marinomonas aquimarina]